MTQSDAPALQFDAQRHLRVRQIDWEPALGAGAHFTRQGVEHLEQHPIGAVELIRGMDEHGAGPAWRRHFRFLSVPLPRKRFLVKTIQFQFLASTRLTSPAPCGTQVVVRRATAPSETRE